MSPLRSERTTPTARSNADDLFGGIAQRFTNVQRSPKFLIARGKLGKNALTPSGIFNDTSVWTAWAGDSTRAITIDGEFVNNRYLFTARPWPATPPNEPGDSRHYIRLRRLRDDQFEWLTNVDITAGRIKPDEFANVISRLMLSGENRTVADIRADYRTNFPRTTAALGRLLSLDTLRMTRDSESATVMLLGIRLTPDGIRSTMPDFAKYLDKYADGLQVQGGRHRQARRALDRDQRRRQLYDAETEEPERSFRSAQRTSSPDSKRSSADVRLHDEDPLFHRRISRPDCGRIGRRQRSRSRMAPEILTRAGLETSIRGELHDSHAAQAPVPGKRRDVEDWCCTRIRGVRPSSPVAA